MEPIDLKWNAKQTGVYCIRNKVNGKVYIGSSTNCYHRVKGQHFDRLQRGTHSNPHLQASWNKYGKKNFECFCIELCYENELIDKEQHWITTTGCLNPALGYNINPHADRTAHTDEQRKKISLSNLGNRRRNLPTGVWKVDNKYGASWTVTVTFQHVKHYLGNFDRLDTASKAHDKTIARLRSGQQPDWPWLNGLRIKRKVALLKCVVCGSEFRKKIGQKYCSVECRGLSRHRQVILSCEVCKKKYQRRQSRSHASRFCSNKCKYKGDGHGRKLND